jgi:homoaconitase/3-isopropylmalate dehydratase large subunit
MTNMAIEAGARTVLFIREEKQKITWSGDNEPTIAVLYSDQDAEYGRRQEVRCFPGWNSVAFPHLPSNLRA